jgi:hypothetical protein
MWKLIFLVQFSLWNPDMKTVYISKVFFFYSPNDYYFVTELLYHGLINKLSTAKYWYTHKIKYTVL